MSNYLDTLFKQLAGAEMVLSDPHISEEVRDKMTISRNQIKDQILEYARNHPEPERSSDLYSRSVYRNPDRHDISDAEWFRK